VALSLALSQGATVYTQVIESGKLPAEPPPNPQFWGDRKIQSPPELGDLGGRRDQNDSQVNLCVHGSFLRGARGDQDSKRSPSIATLLPTGKQAIDSWQPHHDHGHRTFKWKIGVNPIDDEIQWFHALHQQLPRDCQLRLDANAGLSLDAAKRWLEAFEQYPIEYLEQPLPIEQFAAMQTLGETYGTPIALDESIANLQSLKDCHDRGWEGIYVIKPAIVGSPRKLRDFLQCHTLDVVFSSVFETEVGYAAGLRLAEQLGCNRALGYGTNHWWV
jgi:o-succinylbenzoate synthase